MLSVHITAGMLDDFYLASRRLRSNGRPRREDLAGRRRPPGARPALTDAIAADEQWRDLLSLWGGASSATRSSSRGALRPQTLDAAEEKKVEPVFTDLLAAHSRRMSAIGSTPDQEISRA
jgi:hypothetical protein